MSENPDNKNYIGLGPEADDRYLIPVQHQLRFVSRAVVENSKEPVATRLILQQYQWCMEGGKFGWYDIPLATE